VAGVSIVTSHQSMTPDSLNGSVPTSQSMMPPRYPRVQAQAQHPPAHTQTPRVRPDYNKRIDVKG